MRSRSGPCPSGMGNREWEISIPRSAGFFLEELFVRIKLAFLRAIDEAANSSVEQRANGLDIVARVRTCSELGAREPVSVRAQLSFRVHRPDEDSQVNPAMG